MKLPWQLLAGVAAGYALARFHAALRNRRFGAVRKAPSPEAAACALGALAGKRLPLEGRTALVSGAGRGIGRGVAVALARLGADVVVNDLPGDEDSARETQSTIIAMGRQCSVCLADVADAEAVERMVSSAGQLDIIIACAAWSDRSGSIDEKELPLLRRTVEVSQMGVVHIVRSGVRSLKRRAKAVEHAVEQAPEQPKPAASETSAGMEAAGSSAPSGKLVIVSSIMGTQPLSDHATAYSMAKAAVTHLGRCLAAELLPHRINVNVVLPGWVDTPGERKWTADQTIASLGPQMPWGRLGTPEDVGAAVGFLCCDAADYVTGSTLVVDGGYSVALRLPLGATA